MPDLDEEIKDKILKGEYWGKEGAIALSKKQSKKMEEEGIWTTDRLAFLSRFYYYAFEIALSQGALSPFWKKLKWAWRKFLCIQTALAYSDQLETTVGIPFMSPDDVYIRSRILFRWGSFDQALALIKQVVTRDNISLDMRALIRATWGEIMDIEKIKRSARFHHELAFRDLVQLKPRTRVRIYSAMSTHDLRWGETEKAKMEAMRAFQIARDNGLYDEIIRTQALLKKF